MSLNVTFSKSLKIKADTAVIFVHSDKKLSISGKDLDKKASGLIQSAIKNSSKFAGKPGETLVMSLPAKSDFSRVICLGLGKAANLDRDKTETAGGKLFLALEGVGAEKTVLFADENKDLKKINNEALTAHLAMGAQLRAYKFTKYKSKKAKSKTPASLTIVTPAHTKASKLFAPLSSIVQGMYTTRDLVNEPPNHLHPKHYAAFIHKELKPLGVEVNVLNETQMKKLGMGAILAVGQGSAIKPCIVTMHWNGSGKKTSKDGPVALVGKGVTFDTGGISIKPASGMDEMKMDMGGSAAVVGAIKTLALRKSKANVIGIVGLAENMPSSNAYRPGDIIKSYSGKTIEIINTDAEGRLVLADCLTYVQKKYKPSMIVDLATLTGAMMVALGHEYCGTFANDDKLWNKLEKASANTGEKLWRMPLDPVWKKNMESEIADLLNQGGRFAGACTAAGFLEHFIENDTPWAHMDIAGTAWSKKDKPTTPKYGSGFGVRVLNQLIADNYEGK